MSDFLWWLRDHAFEALWALALGTILLLSGTCGCSWYGPTAPTPTFTPRPATATPTPECAQAIARLHVPATASGVEVYVDGQYSGTFQPGPAFCLAKQLAPGHHGYSVWEWAPAQGAYVRVLKVEFDATCYETAVGVCP